MSAFSSHMIRYYDLLVFSLSANFGGMQMQPSDKYFIVLDFNENGTELIFDRRVERYNFWKQLEEKANRMMKDQAAH